MAERGMVKEVRDFFKPNADYSKGIRRSIGVPEFDKFFRAESFCDDETQARNFADAIGKIKTNTSRLAQRQLEKIHRLRNTKGWMMHRLDATDVFRKCGGEADAAWEDRVAGPGITVVRRFLYNKEPVGCGGVTAVRDRASLMAAASY
ncbi:UNVERIFIED_CONTAM: Adenylate isopentenyltransferase 3, chloroplastic [Sesamum radiatum]|uniref:Adenylate isopentenyltransferase 3, chloroplastic n=1 Tax=Sesamum radiatum TaxID=300843 RepID=A0AAW2UNE5_SESRA